MPKIAIIGAGSYVFGRRLVTDFLSYEELRNSTIALMDPDPSGLELTSAIASKIVEQYHFPAKIESTTNRREALEDADYVVISFRVGGREATRLDLEIPAKYGVQQGIGDTLGPGGVFYAMRHIPLLLDICADVSELCPKALVMNYTNPMAMMCWAASEGAKKVNLIGLCHSVQSTAADLARYIGAPLEEVTYWVAGINHMAWFLDFKWKGQDAYPLLREAFKDEETYSNPSAHERGPDIVRAEIFKAFGYFNTESSQHLSEYVPYFRKRAELFEQFKLKNGLEMDSSWRVRKREAYIRDLESDNKIELAPSGEYSARIIHAIETNSCTRINANVKNSGLITNLPNGCCVEVPALVDGTGVKPCFVGDLPSQCAALNRTNINVQELAVKAALEKSKTLAFQAILLDPLTSAILTIDEVRNMVEEMFEAEKYLLPGYS